MEALESIATTDTEIHKDIKHKKETWSSPVKRQQINLFISLRKKYGDSLNSYDTHIPELEKLLVVSKKFLNSSFIGTSDPKKHENINDLFNQAKKLCDEEKLSLPRFKIFLLATQVFISSQNKESHSQLLSDCKNRSHKLWYINFLDPLLKTDEKSLDILSLESIFRSLNTYVTVQKGNTPREYHNLLKQCVEDGTIVPLIGHSPLFGYTDANYAILNGLSPFGISFNKADVHSTFHTEPLDVLIHDLIHCNYAKDVQKAYQLIRTDDGKTFFELLRAMYHASFEDTSENFKKAQYCLFLLLHDPDPIQFNKLHQQLYQSFLNEHNSPQGTSELTSQELQEQHQPDLKYGTYDLFVAGVKALTTSTLNKYSVTSRDKEEYHPNEIKVALADVLKYLREVGSNITPDAIDKLKIAYDLSEAESDQLKEKLNTELNYLFVDFFFSKPIFDKNYIITPAE